MAAEWRRDVGEHSAIREAEEQQRVGGVNGVLKAPLRNTLARDMMAHA